MKLPTYDRVIGEITSVPYPELEHDGTLVFGQDYDVASLDMREIDGAWVTLLYRCPLTAERAKLLARHELK